jgi:hypothetical protein
MADGIIATSYHAITLGFVEKASNRARSWSALWAGSGSFRFLAEMFDALLLAGPLIWVNAAALV